MAQRGIISNIPTLPALNKNKRFLPGSLDPGDFLFVIIQFSKTFLFFILDFPINMYYDKNNWQSVIPLDTF